MLLISADRSKSDTSGNFGEWHVPGSTGTSSNYLFLRTDSLWDKRFDLCLPMADEGPDKKLHRATVMRLDSDDNYSTDARLFERDIPTFYQILIPGDFGYQNYSGLNRQKDQRIYLKGNSLYIKHWRSPSWDDSTLLLDRYVWQGPPRFFVFQSSQVLKRERWY